MITVLDASAAIEIVLQRKNATKLSEYITTAEWVTAPELFIPEVVNTIWKYQKFADLPFPACEKALEYALALPDDFINEQDMCREVFKLSCTLDHPSYDIFYLITARRNNAMLLTLDKKLVQLAVKCNVDVCRL